MWVVNVGLKLVLFRLDCCVGVECWTQVGAVPSGLLCVCVQLSPVACTLVVALFAGKVLKECLVSIKKVLHRKCFCGFL